MNSGDFTSVSETVSRLADVAPDEAARVLRRLPKAERARATAGLGRLRREEVLRLASYKKGSAGSLMTSRYADLSAALTAREAIRQLGAEAEAETIYTAFVVDDDMTLRGSLDLRTLIEAPAKALLSSLVSAGFPSANVQDGDLAVAEKVINERLLALPIVDDGGRLLGIVTHDDAQRHLADMLDQQSDRFHAVTDDSVTVDEDYLDVSPFSEFRRRLPWVLGLAIVGLIAGYVVHAYESALDALVILALYMPMIADTGGNVGTQSSSLIMRALAVNQIKPRDYGRVFLKEAKVAIGLATVLFGFAFLKVLFMSNNADIPSGLTLELIGFAIALAIAVQVIWSTLLGATLPVFARFIRQDPAIVSGPALTTIVDISGLLIYFSLTTSILGIELK